MRQESVTSTKDINKEYPPTNKDICNIIVEYTHPSNYKKESHNTTGVDM